MNGRRKNLIRNFIREPKYRPLRTREKKLNPYIVFQSNGKCEENNKKLLKTHSRSFYWICPELQLDQCRLFFLFILIVVLQHAHCVRTGEHNASSAAQECTAQNCRRWFFAFQFIFYAWVRSASGYLHSPLCCHNRCYCFILFLFLSILFFHWTK